MTRATRRKSFSQIWLWPAVLALLILFGLLSALLGQGGIWWPVSWLTLTIPLAVVVGCALIRSKSPPGSALPRNHEQTRLQRFDQCL
jgi:hypothetical protein